MLTILPPPLFSINLAAALAAEEDGLQIDAVNRIPIILGNFENLPFVVERGVVDQPVKLTVGRMYIGKELLNLGNAGQVGLERPAVTFSGGLLGIRLGAAIVDGYSSTLCGQAQGDRSPDSAGRPCHKNDFPVQPFLGDLVACSSHGRSPLLLTNITGRAWVVRAVELVPLLLNPCQTGQKFEKQS